MNKAFTANINDQVTARGYLDENDQLIMLEPEGSGGGGGDGDFNIAIVTVKNSAESSITLGNAIFVNDEDEVLESGTPTIPAGVTSTYKVVLYKGSLYVFIEGANTFNLTGSVELIESTDNEFTVTGDCTIEAL